MRGGEGNAAISWCTSPGRSEIASSRRSSQRPMAVRSARRTLVAGRDDIKSTGRREEQKRRGDLVAHEAGRAPRDCFGTLPRNDQWLSVGRRHGVSKHQSLPFTVRDGACCLLTANGRNRSCFQTTAVLCVLSMSGFGCEASLPLRAATYCGSIPVRSITVAQRLTSVTTSRASSSGLVGCGSSPTFVSFSRTSGDLSAATIAEFRR